MFLFLVREIHFVNHWFKNKLINAYYYYLNESNYTGIRIKEIIYYRNCPGRFRNSNYQLNRKPVVGNNEFLSYVHFYTHTHSHIFNYYLL